MPPDEREDDRDGRTERTVVLRLRYRDFTKLAITIHRFTATTAPSAAGAASAYSLDPEAP